VTADASTPGDLLQSASSLHRAGRTDQAIALCRKALELDPASDSAHNLLGMLFCVQGCLDEGEDSFRRALDTNPSNADAINNLANVCKERGDLDAAESLYRRGAALQPESPTIHVNLGVVCLARDRIEEAEQCFRRALALTPGDVDARNNLGTVLRMKGELEEAEAEFRGALAADPDHVEANCGLADVLQTRGLLDEAESCCKRALAIRPDCADAFNNLGTIARAMGNDELARAHCNDALRIAPAHVGALNNLGAIEGSRGNWSRAEALYREALARAPAAATTRFNLASALLMNGRYGEGFDLYESRFEAFGRPYARSKRLNERLRARPRWGGEPVNGKRLLLWAEQGLGDTLMMLRYAPLLGDRGLAEVVLLCDGSLARLARLQSGVDRVLTSDEEVEGIDFDVQCPMLSLPRAFRTTRATIPASFPYVCVPEPAVLPWRGRLAGAGMRIGLCWAGSPALRDDAKRSIPLERFAPLFDVRGARWISLQKGPAGAEWAPLRGDGGRHIEECGDFLDTAALISALDLVISVDTAVAHLAGAMNKPVWLLNRCGSEWRWGHEALSTPWYPAMRIFNQRAPGDWSEAIGRVAQELVAEFRGTRT
jgi:tetratricopeptide (TPR) repeat protein